MPIGVTSLQAFRRVFALKLALIAFPFTISSVPQLFVALASIAGFALAWKKSPRIGLLLLLVPLAIVIVPAWPYTINHRVFEALVLFILILCPSVREEAFSAAVIRSLILSVWFYAGLQKLGHGYYLSGEWFSLHAISYGADSGGVIDFLVRGISGVAGYQIPSFTPCCTTTAVSFPIFLRLLFIALGSAVVVAEMGLPLLVLHSRTRLAGLMGLLVLQLTIAFSSGEVDFALSSSACLLLFFPSIATWTYPVLGGFTFLVWGLA